MLVPQGLNVMLKDSYFFSLKQPTAIHLLIHSFIHLFIQKIFTMCSKLCRVYILILEADGASGHTKTIHCAKLNNRYLHVGAMTALCPVCCLANWDCEVIGPDLR